MKNKIILVTCLWAFCSFTFACKPNQFTTEYCEAIQKKGSKKEVFEQLIENSNKGSASASFFLGVMYLHGLNVEENLMTAKQYLEKSARQDYRNAQVALGLMLADGDIPVDADKSLYWLSKGAENGHIVGKYNYAVLVIDNGVPGNDKLAFEYMLEAKKWGYKQANYYLAKSYALGVGVKPSDQMVLKYLKIGATKRDRLSLYALGYAYATGHLVKKDVVQGMLLIKKSAELGEPLAIQYLESNNKK